MSMDRPLVNMVHNGDGREIDDIMLRDEARPRYVYEVWSEHGSKTRFFCKGRLMTGPRIDLGYNICAWSCIMVPSLFYGFVCAPQLLLKEHFKIFPILTFIVLILCIVFFLLTSCSDPGIIPRRSIQKLSYGLAEEINAAIGYDAPIVGDDVAPLTQEQVNEGFRICKTCHIIRPPRASHCSDCDNCVMRFDHHCPFVNNCVGQRNYAFFSGFLLSVTCLGFCVIIGIAFWYKLEDETMRKSTLTTIAYIIAIPVALLVVVIFGFCICHVFLVARRLTTREFLHPQNRAILVGRHSSTLFNRRGISFVRPRDTINLGDPV